MAAMNRRGVGRRLPATRSALSRTHRALACAEAASHGQTAVQLVAQPHPARDAAGRQNHRCTSRRAGGRMVVLRASVLPRASFRLHAHRPRRLYPRLRAGDESLAARRTGRIRIQRYESLLAEPEQQTRALLRFCDLPFDPRCLDYHRAARSVLHRQRRSATTTAATRRRSGHCPIPCGLAWACRTPPSDHDGEGRRLNGCETTTTEARASPGFVTRCVAPKSGRFAERNDLDLDVARRQRGRSTVAPRALPLAAPRACGHIKQAISSPRLRRSAAVLDRCRPWPITPSPAASTGADRAPHAPCRTAR